MTRVKSLKVESGYQHRTHVAKKNRMPNAIARKKRKYMIQEYWDRFFKKHDV